MENENIKLNVVPCDPASDRRSLVTGPESEKWATEGDGGVKPQASSAAAATGDMTRAAAATAAHGIPGPGLKTGRGPRAARSNSRKRAMRHLKEATEDATEEVSGSGRAGSKHSGPRAVPPANRGKNYLKNIKKLQLRQEAERVQALYRHQKDGVMQLPGISALAPAVAACMSRVGDSTATGAGETGHTLATPLYVAHPARDSVSHGGGESRVRLEPAAAHARNYGPQPQKPESDTATTTENNRDLETRKLIYNTSKFVADVSKTALAAQSHSSPYPALAPARDALAGEGQTGGSGREGVIRAEATDNEVYNFATPGDSGRGPKRQRSSDQVSPSLAAADKKFRPAGGTGSSCESSPAGPFGAGTRPYNTDRGEVGSYAKAVKLFRVVVQDKSGVPMDELKATLLRKVINKAQYTLFKSNRGKPKQERKLPQFFQLPRLAQGCLRMTPRDETSLEWLVSTVEHLPPLWGGSGGYRVIPECDLPRYTTAVLYVPDFGEEREDPERWPYILRDYLADTNPDMNMEEWPIFTHIVRERGGVFNHILVMGVPQAYVEPLRLEGFRLHYTTSSIYVKLKTNSNKTGAGAPPRAAVALDSVTASGSDGALKLTDVGAGVQTTEERVWSREEVDRLLEVEDEAEGDISSEIMSLNILSPLSLMEMDKADDQPGPSSGK